MFVLRFIILGWIVFGSSYAMVDFQVLTSPDYSQMSRESLEGVAQRLHSIALAQQFRRYHVLQLYDWARNGLHDFDFVLRNHKLFYYYVVPLKKIILLEGFAREYMDLYGFDVFYALLQRVSSIEPDLNQLCNIIMAYVLSFDSHKESIRFYILAARGSDQYIGVYAILQLARLHIKERRFVRARLYYEGFLHAIESYGCDDLLVIHGKDEAHQFLWS